jgi:hypothetical protein
MGLPGLVVRGSELQPEPLHLCSHIGSGSLAEFFLQGDQFSEQQVLLPAFLAGVRAAAVQEVGDLERAVWGGLMPREQGLDELVLADDCLP